MMDLQTQRPQLHDAILTAAGDAHSQILAGDSFLVDLTPGDMTRYRLFGVFDGREIWIGYECHGAYAFPVDSGLFVHWNYASGKLGISNEHGARIVADFINSLLDRCSSVGVEVVR